MKIISLCQKLSKNRLIDVTIEGVGWSKKTKHNAAVKILLDLVKPNGYIT